MDDEELAQRLKQCGYTLGAAAVRDDGVFLWRINEIFMFRRDAEDLASGGATLGDVIERNQGNVFPTAPQSRSS